MSFLRWAKNLACAALVLTAFGAARAASIEVAPVMVDFAPNRMFTTLTVTNHADDTTAVQLRAFTWSQTADDDILTPTGDMVVSPPIFQLGPREQQTIRVLLRRAPGSTEATYRMLLDELPAAGEPGKIQFALRLSMPIFASPANTSAPVLVWRVVNTPSGAELRVENRGGRHDRISEIVLKLPNGRSIKAGLLHNPYVLAGVERSIPLHIGHLAAGGPATVTGRDDNGVLNAAADIQDMP